MSDSETLAEKRAGTIDAPTALPSDTARLGVDTEGATHFYSRIAQTIAVVSEDGDVHEEDLSERPLQAWIDYVAEERGWETLQYVETVAGLFGQVRVA